MDGTGLLLLNLERRCNYHLYNEGYTHLVNVFIDLKLLHRVLQCHGLGQGAKGAD